eukprot:13722828-Ditylum_brightwellii.AAC.1
MAHFTAAINATIKFYGFSLPAIPHYTCLPLQSSRLLKKLTVFWSAVHTYNIYKFRHRGRQHMQ